MTALKQNGGVLQFLNESFRENKEFVLEAVKTNGLSLAFTSNQLKNDIEVLEKPVKRINTPMSLLVEKFINNFQV